MKPSVRIYGNLLPLIPAETMLSKEGAVLYPVALGRHHSGPSHLVSYMHVSLVVLGGCGNA